MAKNTRRKSGKRDKSNKLLRPSTRAERNTQPNDRVRERLERFSHKSILDGKAAHDTFDGPGQLHAMGYFHNHGHEPNVIRDIFREYGELYWHWYAVLNSGSAEYGPRFGGGGQELSSKSSPLPPTSKAENRFMDLDDILPIASRERRAIHKLALDHWGCDSVHPFVERLVNEGMAGRGLCVAGMLALPSDHEELNAALRAAFALIEGKLKPDYINPLKIAA
jgi:hypothetical protein